MCGFHIFIRNTFYANIIGITELIGVVLSKDLNYIEYGIREDVSVSAPGDKIL